MLPFDLDHLRRAPSMWLLETNYKALAAYLSGIDTVTDHGFLLGFNEWTQLAVYRAGMRPETNVHWSWQALHLAYGKRIGWQQLESRDDHARMISFLLDQLEAFLDYRRKNGLSQIYLEYQQWYIEYQQLLDSEPEEDEEEDED